MSGTITRSYSFANGGVADGGQVDSEIQNIVNDINNLDAAVTAWTNVKTGTLNITAQNASIAMNSQKFTGLGAGTANGDSVRFEQIAVTGSNSALTVTDGAGNAFSGVSSSWWKRYFDASHWEVHIHIEGTSNGSATGAVLRVSGFDFTINTGGTAYGPLGLVITNGGADPRAWTSLTLVSSSVISVQRINAAAWATGTLYYIDLVVVLPI